MIRAITGSVRWRCNRAARAYGTVVATIGPEWEKSRTPAMVFQLSIFVSRVAVASAVSEDQRLPMRASNLREGMRLGPIFYVVSAEQVRKFAAALKCDSPLYRADTPVAPPTMRLQDYALLIAKHFKGGRGGVHAKHWCEFVKPVRAGQAVRVDGTITAAYRKRGKFYFTLEYESHDAASDELLVREAITSVLLSDDGAMQ
jgi:acyl dehydratase